MKYYKVPLRYDDIDRQNLSELAVLIASRPVILYGAGYFGKDLNDFLKSSNINVLCFCDKSEEKQGRPYCGLPVISPLALKNYLDIAVIVVAVSKHNDEICDYLYEAGFPPEKIIVPVFLTNTHHIKVPAETVDANIAAENNWEILSENFAPKKDELQTEFKGPKVLVRTQVFNVPPFYLRRAIESILNQTYRNITYLIIDNASTDGSAEIIEEYRKLDSRIVVCSYNENSSFLSFEQKKKRNAGIWAAYISKHAYMCALDSDDYYEPGFIEETMKLSVKHNADMVVARTLIYQENDCRECMLRKSPVGDLVLATRPQLAFGFHHFYSRLASVWGKLYKTYLLSPDLKPECEIIAGYQGISDSFTSYRRYFSSKTVVFTDQILHHWTVRNSTVTHRLTPDALLVERYVALYHHLKLVLVQNGFSVSEHSEVLDWLLYETGLGVEIDYLEEMAKLHGSVVKQIITKVLDNNLFNTLPKNNQTANAVNRLKCIMERI